MDHRIRYIPTEDGLRRTVRDYFCRVLLREKRTLGVVLLIILTSFVVMGWLAGEPGAIIFGSVVFILLGAAWIKSYMATLEAGRAELRLLDGGAVELMISETGLQFQSPKTNARYSWSDFTSFIETKQSLILLNKRVPVLFFSKENLGEEPLEVVKTRVPPDLKWRKRRGQPRAPKRATVILLLGLSVLLVLAGYGYWSALRVQLSAAAFMDEALQAILAEWSADDLLDRASEEFISERSEAEIRADFQDWRGLGPLVSFVVEKEWISKSISSGQRKTSRAAEDVRS